MAATQLLEVIQRIFNVSFDFPIHQDIRLLLYSHFSSQLLLSPKILNMITLHTQNISGRSLQYVISARPGTVYATLALPNLSNYPAHEHTV